MFKPVEQIMDIHQDLQNGITHHKFLSQMPFYRILQS